MTEPAEKSYQTLRALLALKGYCLARSTDDLGGPLYIVSRLALTRQLHGLAEVEQFVDQSAITRKVP